MTAAQLKRLRYQFGLSLAEAASQVEVSVSTWCRWEAGETPVPERAVKLFKLMNKLTDAQSVTVRELLTKQGELQDRLQSPETRRVATKLEKMTIARWMRESKRILSDFKALDAKIKLRLRNKVK